ncbi:MAG: RNA methyltransferase [Bacteroidales bacterium]|nr:RNA methyltransferase [Bacteroidales bacterium]
MISKNQIKQITALSQKKYRDESGLFIAEGTKLVLDLARSFRVHYLVATADWVEESGKTLKAEIRVVSKEDLNKISNQKTPQGVLAVFEKPDYILAESDILTQLSLALDDVQDPGNLGTIIRVADWFGIRDVICSEHCADAFGTKTVQATMGALARVRVHYVNLENFLQSISKKIPVYGTFMNGNDIYSETLSQQGIVLMGNEGNGISEKIEKLVTKRLLIPNFPKGEPTSESLNVSVATALVCAEFRRRG